MPRKQKIDRSSGMIPLEVTEIVAEITDNSLELKSGLPQVTQLGARLIQHGSGEYLRVFFRVNQENVSTYDFSNYLNRREIAISFAEAFYAWGLGQRERTRKKVRTELSFFFTFLDEFERKNSDTSLIITLKQITTSLINAYIDWLNNVKASRGRNQDHALSNNTKSRRLAPVKIIMAWLKQHYPKKVALNCEIPYNPWPNRAKHILSTPILSKSTQQALERACLEEVEEVWNDFQYGRFLIDQNLPQLPLEENLIDFDDLGICLAYIERHYAGFVPFLDKYLKHKKPKLYRAIKRKHGGRERINRYLRPTIKMLLPFIVLIISRTFANPDSILCMERNCIEDHPVLPHRKTVRWFKNRANCYQKRSYSSITNHPSSVLVIIERVRLMTESLASKIKNPHCTNRLFLYYALTTGEIGSFDNSGSSNTTLSDALTQFQKKYCLEKFNLKSLRVTGADRTDEITDGDINARKVILNHKHVQVTQSYYTSDAIRRRNYERIAHIQGELIDWVRTGEKLDPRSVAKCTPELSPLQVKEISNGQHASTSGFTCRNPLDSPQPGEVKEKLCASWLSCFICTNAIIILDAETLARFLQLEEHLIKARSKINPMRFALLYKLKLEILQDELLPQFSDPEIQIQAEKLLPTLIPLPDIE